MFLYYIRDRSAVDEYASFIKLSVDFADGFTNLINSGTGTASNSASMISTTGPTGATKNVLDISGSGYLTFEASDDTMSNPAQAYTLEGWIKSSSDGTLFTTNEWSSGNANLTMLSTNRIALYGTSYGNMFTNYWTTPANQWYHYAVVYQPIVGFKSFVNGVQMVSIGYPSPERWGTIWRIGALPGAASSFTGQVSSIRLTAAARYITDFTPPNF